MVARLAPVVLLLLAGPAAAQAPPAAGCVAAAAQAEQDHGIPAGLLLAIGTVESGRRDLSGRQLPSPYAVNVNGEGRYFDDAAAAIAHVQAARAAGARSIDVGCFQVSLLHHPNAFASLADGFDPVRNGAYAAGFLTRLQQAAGSWTVAAGHYHSMTPALAEPYAARVLAAWQGTPAEPAVWRAPRFAVVPVFTPFDTSAAVQGPALRNLPIVFRPHVR